jgi:hypothetical protein
MNIYQSYTPPKKEGCWVISGDLHIYVAKKPNWFHKKITKFLFGWDWKDGDYETQLKEFK